MSVLPRRSNVQSGKLNAMTARTLVLLRHAKAEVHGGKPDFDRVLSDRGRADAGAAGSWLADEGLRPGLVICSPSVRTRQTWHGVAIAYATADPNSGAPEVHYEQKLYDGGRTELVDLVQAVSDDIVTVLVIGHNPTVSDVSLLLLPDHTVASPDGLRPSGLAVHRVPGSWSSCEPGTAELVKTHTARA
jgi:phosphohistidine phosphatase